MPTHNGRPTLERAIVSVLNQRFRDWELLIIDDRSTDGTVDVAAAAARHDARIKVLLTPENSGPAAARNVGLHAARGEAVAYLDCDDEYYPDYLERAAPALREGDVVICRYDTCTDDGAEVRPISTWDPASAREQLFARNISTCLGVLHRREPAVAAGGFNEQVWHEEDWDLWRRLARSGAEFLFLPVKSGKYHGRSDSQSRRPNIPARLREGILENRAAGRPLYSFGEIRPPKRTVEKIAFVSLHSVIDFSSGAAVATLRALEFLQRIGFSCEVFCGPLLDLRREELVEELLARQGTPYEARRAKIGEYEGRLLFTRRSGVSITMFCGASTVRGFVDQREVEAFLEAYRLFLKASRPDAVLMFGGDWVSRRMAYMAKYYDLPVVFWLHNFAYRNERAFGSVDHVIVPSEFSRRHHWDQLGLDCTVLPNVIEDEAARVGDRRPQYLTLVNPQPAKGVYVFARIASELARRRPDIPLLVVEGRGTSDVLRDAGVDLDRLGNIRLMPNTPRPREFYEITKLLLMPSLWDESFGLAAAEAMYNGIPVLASDRGALPEIVRGGGFLFSVPARYTPQTSDVPAPEEIEPWVETVIRLWDDPQEYAAASDRATRHSRCWHPERLALIYREFFSNLVPQPFPPLAPPGVR